MSYLRFMLTKKQWGELIDEYLKGSCPLPLSKKYGIKKSTIISHIRRLGLAKTRSAGTRDRHDNRRREHNANWRGGTITAGGDYFQVKVEADDFFFPMTHSKGYVLEHRLIMAKFLGRCLQNWELIHHKNGVKHDNRIENLELTTNGSHIIEHNKGYQDGYLKGIVDGHDKAIKALQGRVTLLEAENTLLKMQLVDGGVPFQV